MGKVVGIDLGTTNSCVAVMEGGKPTVIANAEGFRTTPSVVAYTKNQDQLVGQIAKRQAVMNPENTFYSAKRFVGRRVDEVNEESKEVSYSVEKSGSSVKLKCPILDKQFSPEEVSSQVLRKLADDAGKYLGDKVTQAVITVPAYFNDSQRQATKDAGKIAGLEVLRIVNEPTAAALAYGLDKENEKILVFDLGGGTFDVSVIEAGDGVTEVLSTSGDTHLGGDDFDRCIVDHLASTFKSNEGIDLRQDKQALQRLTEAAEKAKIELSNATQSEINLPFITATPEGPKHLDLNLTRAKFEELAASLIDRCKTPVERAISDAKISTSEIDEVVMVGGSSRIPAVLDLVKKIIGKEPNQTVNPDEVVAVGAAIQSGIISGDLQDLLLNDVTPLSLGLETIGGLMKVLIPRNTPIPVRQSDVFSTSEANQSSVVVQVRQGERPLDSENKSLGKFRLSGIPPAPRGIPQVQVAFDIDANGLLEVSATDRTTGRKQTVTISGGSNLNEQEINSIIEEAKAKANEDRKRRSVIDRKNSALTLIAQAERRLRDASLEFGPYGAERQQRAVELAIQDVEEYIDDDDPQELEISVSSLQEALFGLNRKFAAEKKTDNNPLQSIKNTFGSLKDELFSDDYWDDDPWDNEMNRNYKNSRYGNSRDEDPWDNDYFL